MSSCRSILALCVCQLVTVSAEAQEPGLPASSAEPPPLEGGAPPPATPPPATVAAAPAEPEPDPAPPPAPAAASETTSGPSADSDAVFRAFAVYAAGERDRRILGAVGGVVAGVTTIALGATIAEPTGTDADVWYVVGGVSVGLSLLGLVFPSPAEGIARAYRVKDSGHSTAEARALEIKWNDYALAAKRRRMVGGAVSLLVSAGFLGSGIAIATGAGDFSDSDRAFWGAFLIASGAAVGVSGVANLLVKSGAERSFEAYRALRPETTALFPVLAVGPAGLMAGAAGTF